MKSSKCTVALEERLRCRGELQQAHMISVPPAIRGPEGLFQVGMQNLDEALGGLGTV
jgi:hypothetical protein